MIDEDTRKYGTPNSVDILRAQGRNLSWKRVLYGDIRRRSGDRRYLLREER